MRKHPPVIAKERRDFVKVSKMMRLRQSRDSVTELLSKFKKLKTLELGITDFRKVWELQRELQQKLVHEAPDAEETLILCEHHSVITHGKSAKSESLLTPASESGIEVIQIERGGDYTYHGPGQLIAYPILDLKKRKRDVGWYLRTLEEIVIQTLQAFDIEGVRIEGRTGVWIDDNKKICSMGVRLSKWCTMHGLALNVTKESTKGFQWIHPCGFTDIEMVSMEDLTSSISLSNVSKTAISILRDSLSD